MCVCMCVFLCVHIHRSCNLLFLLYMCTTVASNNPDPPPIYFINFTQTYIYTHPLSIIRKHTPTHRGVLHSGHGARRGAAGRRRPPCLSPALWYDLGLDSCCALVFLFLLMYMWSSLPSFLFAALWYDLISVPVLRWLFLNYLMYMWYVCMCVPGAGDPCVLNE